MTPEYKNEKKPINPMVATVLIIAVTLIAAVAIGGFVFGIFSSAAGEYAHAEINSTSCIATNKTISCIIEISNTGNAPIVITGSEITVTGQVDSSVKMNDILSEHLTNYNLTINYAPIIPIPKGNVIVGVITFDTGMELLFTSELK